MLFLYLDTTKQIYITSLNKYAGGDELYIKCECPYCQKIGYHFLSINYEEISTEEELKKYIIESVKVKHSQTEEVILKMV
jgi:5,10-methylene-tetrahydrofolate dehydrogenase/methenyl tetrahydrofolate cyclohydrolase